MTLPIFFVVSILFAVFINTVTNVTREEAEEKGFVGIALFFGFLGVLALWAFYFV